MSARKHGYWVKAGYPAFSSQWAGSVAGVRGSAWGAAGRPRGVGGSAVSWSLQNRFGRGAAGGLNCRARLLCEPASASLCL